jgi:hypothetical protein
MKVPSKRALCKSIVDPGISPDKLMFSCAIGSRKAG